MLSYCLKTLGKENWWRRDSLSRIALIVILIRRPFSGPRERWSRLCAGENARQKTTCNAEESPRPET